MDVAWATLNKLGKGSGEGVVPVVEFLEIGWRISMLSSGSSVISTWNFHVKDASSRSTWKFHDKRALEVHMEF